MTWLLTSDLHLSDSSRDEYRFGLFEFLAKQQELHKVTATFILGDITEKKDKHSAKLVNRVVDELTRLRPPIYILRGNHDGSDPEHPFFRFVNYVEGASFVAEPTVIDGVALIPHQISQEAFDAALAPLPKGLAAIMCHQTFGGARAETGTRLNGLQASPIELLQPGGCWAGDVHKPQRCGPVTYVGAPFHVRFGDDYQPRALLVKNGKEQNLYFQAPRKWALTIRDANDLLHNEDLHPQDQVKLNLELTREELVDRDLHRQDVLAACRDLQLAVYGLKVSVLAPKKAPAAQLKKLRTKVEIVQAFCVSENVASNIKQVGLELIGETK